LLARTLGHWQAILGSTFNSPSLVFAPLELIQRHQAG